ncbi:MAG: phospholipase D-like domain-containing protein [Bacteroidia bacterium]|nr:phospholipase D-like domain-containing protein [Bacteroidia bacterium]
MLQTIDEAEDEILVAVYWFTNHKLFDKLCDKVKAGKKVWLIIHNDYINNREAGLDFQSFIDLGGQFFFSDAENPMHNKFCVVDGKTLINGSYNWTYYAEDRNSENILIIKDEISTASAFRAEFLKLADQLQRVEKVEKLTKFELDEFNGLDTREYLANDIVYEAKATNRPQLVDTAFQLAPTNIKVQQVAFKLDLTIKRKLRFSLGASIQGNRYLVIVKKGALLPITMTKTVVTVEDNQRTATASIYYGENPIASRNRIIIDSMTLAGLPPKPAGEAVMKYIFTINIYGKLTITKYSLDNGRRVSNWADLTALNLLEPATADDLKQVQTNE